MTDETSTAAAEATSAAPDKPKRAVRVPGAVTAAETAGASGAAADPTAGLPNAIDIDAYKLKAPVLTRQGWVVPPDYGQPGKR